MNVEDNLLEIKGLRTYFYTLEGVAKAVDGIDLSMRKGQILGLVGESGCGKSVLALSILRVVPSPGKICAGEIEFEGKNLLQLSMARMRRIRGDAISIIFQEPMTSLNPVFTIGHQISETYMIHRALDKREALEKTIEMLQKVGIPSPERRVQEYPHQLSGGMRQRVMIAMALSCNPKLLIADEPTTALDVTIQAQILDLMLNLKDEFETSIVLITHNLGVIAEMAERVIVMYAGRVMEEATITTLFYEPLHPYTQGLLRSIPRVDRVTTKGQRRLQEIPGIVPGMTEVPYGCKFHPRCPDAAQYCRGEEPQLRIVKNDHFVRCWKTDL